MFVVRLSFLGHYRHSAILSGIQISDKSVLFNKNQYFLLKLYVGGNYISTSNKQIQSIRATSTFMYNACLISPEPKPFISGLYLHCFIS